MIRRETAKLLAILVIAAPMAFSLVQAQQTPPSQPPAQQELKNLQVLKGMTRPQVIQEMRNWAAALGVECNFCHQAPFETDTPRKQVTRLMLRDYVNAMKHKDGSAVTCKDCHQELPNPLRTRPFDGALAKPVSGLQVIQRNQIGAVMQAFNTALGVDCEYCHKGDSFETETALKQITRFMMTEYSRGLTKQDGSAVSCNDCHQGHARPLVSLPFPRREQNRPAPGGEQKKPGN